MNIIEVRDKLVEIRKQQCVTQNEIAERIGINQNAVSLIETRPKIGWNALEKYASGLGRKLTVIIENEDVE